MRNFKPFFRLVSHEYLEDGRHEYFEKKIATIFLQLPTLCSYSTTDLHYVPNDKILASNWKVAEVSNF